MLSLLRVDENGPKEESGSILQPQLLYPAARSQQLTHL